jgi:hypothetical protein
VVCLAQRIDFLWKSQRLGMLSYDIAPVCYMWVGMCAVRTCISTESLRFPRHLVWGISGVYCKEIAILL